MPQICYHSNKPSRQDQSNLGNCLTRERDNVKINFDGSEMVPEGNGHSHQGLSLRRW
jgi:hypothetical protein